MKRIKPIVLYISGGMRKVKKKGFENFFRAERKLIKKGFKTINPARHDIKIGIKPDDNKLSDEQIGELLLWDLKQIVRECDGIYMLKHWRNSEGATIEWLLAKTLHKKIFYEGQKIKL